MLTFEVRTSRTNYLNFVERGCIRLLPDLVPQSVTAIFIVTTEDVWRLHGERLRAYLPEVPHHVLFFPGGEQNNGFPTLSHLPTKCLPPTPTAAVW